LAEYAWKPYAKPGDAGGQALYWHRVYKIISAEYEWKPCAGRQVLYWHRVYEIFILAEYERKPCAGPGDAGGQVLYWHRVYKIISAE
jgi:hypothetical protein